MNTYAYVGNDPISNDDPLGLRRPPRERIPPRYRDTALPPWLRNPNQTEWIPPPHVVPGMNELLKRNLEEAIESIWIDLIFKPMQEREKRALERLLEWQKQNPLNENVCTPDDQDRIKRYYDELRRMHRQFQREIGPPR